MPRNAKEEAGVAIAGMQLRFAGGPPGYLERWAPATSAGRWEAPVLQVLSDVLRTNSSATFVDVGAYIGIYSVLASRLLPLGKVAALEPDPTAYSELVYNIALNQCTNVRAHRVAIGAHTGWANFEATADSRSHLLPTGRERVFQMELDSLCAQEEMIPRVIKIDIEGGETIFSDHLPAVIDEAEIVVMEVHDRPPFNLDGAIDSLLARIEPYVVLQRKSAENFHVAFGQAVRSSRDPADWTLRS